MNLRFERSQSGIPYFWKIEAEELASGNYNRINVDNEELMRLGLDGYSPKFEAMLEITGLILWT